jgi:hypothetical protein
MSIKEPLKKAGNWFKRLGSWLSSDVVVWLGQLRILGIAVFGRTNLLVVCFVVIVPLLLGSCLEQKVRLAGLVLQLSGFATIALKLRSAQHQFQLPTTNIWLWLKQFPRFPSSHVFLSAAGTALATSSASARMRVSAGPATPLNRRVELLEQKYAELFDEVGRLDQEVKANAREISEALKAESDERQKADRRHDEQLQEAIAGHLHLDWAGVWYFVLGTIAGTASGELARWLGAAPCS